MNSLFENSTDDRFTRFLTIAITAHLGIVLLGFLLQQVLNIDFFKVDIERKDLNIIQSSVRVDVVAMPKFTVQELKKMQVAPAPSEEVKEDAPTPKEEPAPVKEDEVTFKKKGKKKIDLKNLLSNIGKKSNSNSKKKKTKKANDLSKHSKQLRSLVLEGNKVSQGTNVVGDSLAQDSGKFTTYVSSLPNFVRPFWKLPTYLIDRDLKCRIRIFIAANGKILKADIFESSGVDEFDQKALAALGQVKSLPAPESEILPRVAGGEVVLGFPL